MEAVKGRRQLEPILIAWGFSLNLAWELAQSPLYSDHGSGWRYLAWTRLHCTLGDVLILLGAFWATAAVFRSRQWPVTRGGLAAAAFLGFGLAYTAWSEWFNTGIRGGWTYVPAMPRVWAIGLAPLAQWLVLPALLVLVMRFSACGSKSTGG